MKTLTLIQIDLLLRCHFSPDPGLDIPEGFDPVEEWVGLSNAGAVVFNNGNRRKPRLSSLGRAWLEALTRVPCPRQQFLDPRGRLLHDSILDDALGQTDQPVKEEVRTYHDQEEARTPVGIVRGILRQGGRDWISLYTEADLDGHDLNKQHVLARALDELMAAGQVWAAVHSTIPHRSVYYLTEQKPRPSEEWSPEVVTIIKELRAECRDLIAQNKQLEKELEAVKSAANPAPPIPLTDVIHTLLSTTGRPLFLWQIFDALREQGRPEKCHEIRNALNQLVMDEKRQVSEVGNVYVYGPVRRVEIEAQPETSLPNRILRVLRNGPANVSLIARWLDDRYGSAQSHSSIAKALQRLTLSCDVKHDSLSETYRLKETSEPKDERTSGGLTLKEFEAVILAQLRGGPKTTDELMASVRRDHVAHRQEGLLALERLIMSGNVSYDRATKRYSLITYADKPTPQDVGELHAAIQSGEEIHRTGQAEPTKPSLPFDPELYHWIDQKMTVGHGWQSFEELEFRLRMTGTHWAAKIPRLRECVNYLVRQGHLRVSKSPEARTVYQLNWRLPDLPAKEPTKQVEPKDPLDQLTAKPKSLQCLIIETLAAEGELGESALALRLKVSIPDLTWTALDAELSKLIASGRVQKLQGEPRVTYRLNPNWTPF